jgi:NAD(P)-dependent dehydrogenase (short-subunit alcohol dehydrogenase family)
VKRVNTFAPARVVVGFSRSARDTAPDPAAMQAKTKTAHLLGRMARPKEMAEAIAFLLSTAASSSPAKRFSSTVAS